ncbi:MAG TPA: hypothetical protein VM434_06315 [Beijerinckiaceae bacterium]|nr:hypothetical protein [Beijerinckiaceae bacterium]
MKTGGTARTYNLFRRKREADLVCAVPEDCAVPAFVDGRGWEYGGRTEDGPRAPPGFDSAAARQAVRLSGFYLFHRLRA